MHFPICTILFPLTLVFLAAFSACVKDSTPVETCLTATPDSVFPGDTVNLEFTLTGGGLDMDILTLEWQAGDGSFIQATDIAASLVKWIAPKTPGDHFITLVTTISVNVCHDSLLVHVKDTMGSFVDTRDGHEYEWVKIGSQFWMAENLVYLPSVSPPDKGSETEPSYYVYAYEGSSVPEAIETINHETYGVLYNWAAALTSSPDGWHLPSQTEFEILCSNFSDFQKSLKSATHWFDDGNGDNSSGFNGRPAGFRIRLTYDSIDYFEFYSLGEYTSYWTDSLWENNIFKDPVAIVLRLNKWGRYGIGDSPYKNIDFGFSVRCVKDD